MADEWGDERWSEEDEIPLDRTEFCDWCGRFKRNCTCDDALFDADELGLDPEEDRGTER